MGDLNDCPDFEVRCFGKFMLNLSRTLVCAVVDAAFVICLVRFVLFGMEDR